jgi:hypothetical protein
LKRSGGKRGNISMWSGCKKESVNFTQPSAARPGS